MVIQVETVTKKTSQTGHQAHRISPSHLILNLPTKSQKTTLIKKLTQV